MVVVLEVVVVVVSGVIDLNVLVHTNEDISNGHLVHSEGAGLVRANVVCTAHDFARGELLNEVLINEHFTDRVGKSNHNGQRETFGYGDDNDGNSNDKILKPFDEVCLDVVDLNVEDRVRAVKIHLSVGELLNEKSKEKDV